MPDLDFALLCDHVRADGLVHIIGGSIDTVTAPQVPTGQNLGIAARFVFTRGECNHPHRVEILFQDTDGRELVRVDAMVEPRWVEGLPPGWKTGASLGLNFGVPLPAYGIYTFEILVNGSSLKSLPLRVIPPPTTGG